MGTGERSVGSPFGAHSMLYLNTPFSAMRAMFEQAADMGASWIRLDLELSAVFPGERREARRGTFSQLLAWNPHSVNPFGSRPEGNPLDHPQWRAVDEYMRLARRYHLHVLPVLTATPPYMAACPPGTPRRASYRCPPGNPHEWARAVGEIAAHTRGVIDHFEIMNEPDGRWAFLGSPQQYAHVLSDSYQAIHRANPSARVVLGGLIIGSSGMRWMDAMLATPGTYAIHRFDISNIHVRVKPSLVTSVVCRWRSYFASYGFRGPLWVTETGYPANARAQRTPGFQDGPPAQARWLTAVIPELLAAGVASSFVTERDWGHGAFASEGVLQTPNPLPPNPHLRRLPGFFAVRRLADGAWIAATRAAARRAAQASGPGGSCPAG